MTMMYAKLLRLRSLKDKSVGEVSDHTQEYVILKVIFD